MQEVGGLNLLPIDLTIDNLASSGKQRSYQQLKPVLGLARVPVSASALGSSSQSDSSAAAHAALKLQPQALERVFEDMVGQIETGSKLLEPDIHSLLHLQHELDQDRKSTRLNSSHSGESRMPSSA